MDKSTRRKMLDKVSQLNQLQYEQFGDPEITAKIQQYEMAYRMQTAVPEIMDVSKESDDIIKLYGPECLVPGTYAAIACWPASCRKTVYASCNCTTRDGTSMQPSGRMRSQALDVDQASAALITDLKQRGCWMKRW
jgi:hypothetical protein